MGLRNRLKTFLRNPAPDTAGHGFVRCPDHWLQPAVWLRDCEASSQRSCRLDQRDNQPDSRVGCTSDDRGLSLGRGARYLIRDRDRIYGTVVTRRLRAMGIRDKPTAPASPWQNGFAERLIGSILRECMDHVIVLGEAHLRRIPKSCADYYNGFRTHRSLHKDAPISRPVQRSGLVSSHALLGGLHHHYVRI
jgi:hypothetical protein